MPWDFGQRITRREILGFEPTNTMDSSVSWFGKSWLDIEARVVEDTPSELVLYIPTASPMVLPEYVWPAEGGVHPWTPKTEWQGPGCLMWHIPGEHHAVWHFYDEEDNLLCWYINMQMAFRRTETTFETQDLELDFVVGPDFSWEIKDWDAIPDRVSDGRFSPELGEWIYEYGRSLITRLENKDFWWPTHWADWRPPEKW